MNYHSACSTAIELRSICGYIPANSPFSNGRSSRSAAPASRRFFHHRDRGKAPPKGNPPKGAAQLPPQSGAPHHEQTSGDYRNIPVNKRALSSYATLSHRKGVRCTTLYYNAICLSYYRLVTTLCVKKFKFIYFRKK